ncbi:MAG: GGDEF domain-containing protein [Moraxellaceae bacterium]
MRRLQLRHLVSAILDWSPTQRLALLLALLFGQFLLYSVWAGFVLYYPQAQRYISLAILIELFPAYFLILIYLAALYFCCRLLAHHPHSHWHSVMQFVVAMSLAIGIPMLAVLGGLLSLGAGMLVLGIPILGLFFFQRWASYLLFAFSVLVFVALVVATAVDYLPYAPLLTDQGLMGGKNSGFWLYSTIFFNLMYVGLLFGMIDQLIQEFKSREQKVRYLSEHDELTGLLNRRAVQQKIQLLLGRARRSTAVQVSVLVLDLDFFKSINDRWGHLVGDEVLMACAHRLQQIVAERGWVSRYGGEEFLVLLLQHSPQEAELLAERICEGIRQLQVRCDAAQSVQLTVSVGVASQAVDRVEAIFALIHQADQALYLAKERGRNQVVLAESTVDQSS